MLRASSYTIYVDLPGEPDEMLLVHGYTGSFDKVSRRVATFVRSLEVGPPPKPLFGAWSPEALISEGESVAPAEETISLLKRRGYLTELDVAQEENLFARIVQKLHERDLRQMPNYIFMPTYDCNLRCSYCFQDHMRTNSRFKHLLKIMQPEVMDRILSVLPQIEHLHGIEAGDQRARNIGFFGGEPLLTENRPIIEYIMSSIASLGKANFWAVTNATDLESYADLLGPGKISSVQITLDGPPDEHDKRRIYEDGSGSFEKIAANITLALELNAAVSVRLNIDRNNIQDLPRLADEMIERGWNKYPQFSAYTAPITAENEKTDKKTTLSSWHLDQELARLREVYPKMRVIERPDDKLIYSARRIFAQSHASALHLKSSFCSAHNRMYIFDAFGDIYACWEKTGDQRIRIGTVGPTGNLNLYNQPTEEWRSRTVASNPICRQCRYALHCGGGCAILALGKTGEFHSNFCDGFQSRFRASVAEAYGEHISGKEVSVASERVCDL